MDNDCDKSNILKSSDSLGPDARLMTNAHKLSSTEAPKGSSASLISMEPMAVDEMAPADIGPSDITGNTSNLEQQDIDYYRTTGTIQAFMLLVLDYTTTAPMSYGWVFHELGWVLSILLLILIVFLAYVSGIFVLKVCLAYPKTRDFAQFTQVIFNGSRWALEFGGLLFALNNLFLLGLQIQQSTSVLNTLTNNALCTAVFAVILSAFGIFATLPRTFAKLTIWSVLSLATFLVAIFLSIAFAKNPTKNIIGYNPDQPRYIRAFPTSGKRLSLYVSAVLNLIFPPMGQMYYPSFIFELKNPRKFKAALQAIAIYLIIFLVVIGALMSIFFGQYSKSPIMSTLTENAKKWSYAWILPMTMFGAPLNVATLSKIIFKRVAQSSPHYSQNTWTGWIGWVAIITFVWFAGCFISLAFPNFSLLVSILSSVFSPSFGMILPSIGYLFLCRTKKHMEPKHKVPYYRYIAYFLIVFGATNLVLGLYSSINELIVTTRDGSTRPFSCADNSI